MKKLIAIVALAAACSGCANFFNHADAGERTRRIHPYSGTCDDFDAMKSAFVTPPGPEGSLNQAIATIMFPVLLVDFPFEIVADTITLPYDGIKYLQRRKADEGM